MVTPKERSDAFLDWCDQSIAERRVELAPYEDGSQRVIRRAGGEWVDITKERIEQIGREIKSLEAAITRHKEHWKL
jgi:hypothetical protein